MRSVGLLSLENEREYVLQDIWMFSIKQKRVCLKMKFSIKDSGKFPYLYLENLESKLKTWRESSGLLYKEGRAL